MLANKRYELIGCDEKCNRINKAEQPQDDKSGQPIGVSECGKLFEKAVVVHNDTLCVPTPHAQCSMSNIEPELLEIDTLENRDETQTVIHGRTSAPMSNGRHPTAIPHNQFAIRNENCQGGDSNSRPTPKAFGAALPLQIVNRKLWIFLSL